MDDLMGPSGDKPTPSNQPVVRKSASGSPLLPDELDVYGLVLGVAARSPEARDVFTPAEMERRLSEIRLRILRELEESRRRRAAGTPNPDDLLPHERVEYPDPYSPEDVKVVGCQRCNRDLLAEACDDLWAAATAEVRFAALRAVLPPRVAARVGGRPACAACLPALERRLRG